MATMHEDAGRPERSDEEEFALLLRDIWTSVVRLTRTSEHLPAMPAQHVEVLQRVAAADGLTPAQLASAMRLSRPTISELVRRMVGEDLLERVPSETDGRSVRLVPTPTALGVMQAFRHGVAGALAAGLEQLPQRDRRRLLGDLPALRLLREHIDSIADSAGAMTEERTA